MSRENDLANAVKSVVAIVHTEMCMAIMEGVKISMEVDFANDKVVFKTEGLKPHEKEVFRREREPLLALYISAFLSATADSRLMESEEE